jgi:hypothetical protein
MAGYALRANPPYLLLPKARALSRPNEIAGYCCWYSAKGSLRPNSWSYR